MPEKPTLELYLIHGRLRPEQDMEDWGTDGPRLKGVTGIHQTYGSPANIVFTDKAAADEAQRITGWAFWDENMLTMKWEGDLVVCYDAKTQTTTYYGDWGIMIPKKEKNVTRIEEIKDELKQLATVGMAASRSKNLPKCLEIIKQIAPLAQELSRLEDGWDDLAQETVEAAELGKEAIGKH